MNHLILIFPKIQPMPRQRKNNLCPKGHLVIGKNKYIDKRGHSYCVKCKVLSNNRLQKKPKDLPAPRSEKIDDELSEQIFPPNGEFRNFFNLGTGNRWVSRKIIN